MISVPNHLRPLNGSKLFLLLCLLFGLTFAACKTTKPSSTTYPKPKPKTEKPEEKKEEVTKKETDEKPEEKKEEDTKPTTKTGPQHSLNIGLLIPFNASDYYPGSAPLPAQTERFLNFYQGFLLGLEELEQHGLRTRVDVYDTKNDKEIFGRTLDGLSENPPDFVLGAYHSANIRALAKWTKEHKVIGVSPWKSSTSVSEENPYFLQINPTLDLYFKAIVEHADASFDHRQILLVSRDVSKEKKRLKSLQEARAAVGNSTPYREYIIPGDIRSLEVDALALALHPRQTVVILPYYRNESFVQLFLSKLAAAKGDNDVVIYGMPNWLDFESLQYEQMVSLNVRLPIHQYVDHQSVRTSAFRKKYADRYGMIPTHNDAFKGYDLAIFAGSGYQQHGTAFLSKLSDENQTLSTMDISIQPKYPVDGSNSEDYSKIDFFENTSLQIREFGFNGFQRIN